MTIILTLLISYFGFNTQHSSDLASTGGQVCEFVPKARSHGLLKSLPPQAIGFVDCFRHFPDSNTIIVAKFPHLDDKTLIDYVTDVGRKTDLTSQRSSVGWQSKASLSSRQFIVQTISPAQESRPEKVMAHYAFVAKSPAGGFLVFVHSASAAQTHRIRQTLMSINHELDNQALLRQMI